MVHLKRDTFQSSYTFQYNTATKKMSGVWHFQSNDLLSVQHMYYWAPQQLAVHNKAQGSHRSTHNAPVATDWPSKETESRQSGIQREKKPSKHLGFFTTGFFLFKFSNSFCIVFLIAAICEILCKSQVQIVEHFLLT